MVDPIILGHAGSEPLEIDLDRLVGSHLGIVANAGGGTFGTYLSRLAGPELIERDRTRGVRLKPEMMG